MNPRHLITLLTPGLLVLAALAPTPARAETGVSDERVSLPEGPGSLEGVGENVEMDPNMGNMSYSVPIDVPQGFDAVTPNLTLGYNSGGGGSVVGMGWSMPTPSIERMTYRGLPEYDRADDFSANGSDQLVLIPGSDPPVYRSRYEKGFTRTTWMDAGDGREGYWIAEHPDGSKSYFGATADGTLVPEARMGTEALGTFRYMLVEKVDVYGHRMVYQYALFGRDTDNPDERPGVPLMTSVGYVYTTGDAPLYRVDLVYNERMDDTGVDYLSDAKPGFNELLTQRLARVDVHSREQRIRSYRLSYERYADSGGFTRLTGVESVGAEGGVYPVAFAFDYSSTLGSCQEEGCRPVVVEMGSLGVSLGSGRATLLDINGDALPDVIDTSEDGAHRFFLNVARSDGTSRFETTPVTSQVGRGSDFRLGAPGTQVLDANGDGFTDLLNAASGQVLFNDGRGDWLPEGLFEGAANLAQALADDFDASEGELQSLRFMDFDNDKRIDLMRSTQTETSFLVNLGADQGFVNRDDVDVVGAGFEQDNLQLSDMNGDGLQDIVQVAIGQLRYRLNLGWGRWGGWVTVNVAISDAEVALVELEDINGDGMADLVIVSGATVKYALNRNTTAFSALITLTSDAVTGDIPTRQDGTNVLYADMNANGSSDVVWIDASGDTTYLELFPIRPNMMTRITNGIGQVTDISYSSSVQMQALDREEGAAPWVNKLPHPMLVVASLDKYDLLTDVHEITTYRYHDGFYDGIEKQFRGYERVEATLLGDASQEEGLTEITYDVGAADPYRNGLMLTQAVSSSGQPLTHTEMTYEDCDVAEVPDGTELPVRHICQTATRTTIMERASASEHVVTESRSAYDGYGNVTLQSNLGVVSVGGAGCGACPADRDLDAFGAPCDRGGDLCVGDEMYTETARIEPGDDTNGRWIISAPYQERTFGREGSEWVKETRTYYDGEDFVGMELGALDQGKVTRVTQKVEVGSETVIETVRNAYDEHGNVIATLDPLGEIGGSAHQRRYVYDAPGLRVVQADLLLEDPDGAPYALRRELVYEPLFDKVTEGTDWMRVVDGEAVSVRRSFAYLYDEFGRMLSQVMPGGDTPSSPTETYQYELGSPVSRIITRRRSEVGGALDLEEVRCMDGRGRTYQLRQKIEGDLYQVDGFKVYNVQSNTVRVHQPYTATSGACDTEEPDGALFTEQRYDAAHRAVEVTRPDAGIYGDASVTRTVFAPLTTLSYDAEDTDDASPHADTPLITREDGLGRVVAMERVLGGGGAQPTIRLTYDPLGRLVGVTDPAGNHKTQEHDLLDRVVRILDPNTADETTFEYDDAGNVIRAVDDRQVVTLSAYDGLNRKVRAWDEADPEGTAIRWRYDADPSCDPETCTHTEGKLVTVTWPGPGDVQAVERSGYDLRGRTLVTSRELAGVPFITRAEHDNVDRRLTTTWPNGERLRYRYDGASRMTGIDGLVDGITYTERNQFAGASCADGSSSLVAYDDLMRPSERLVMGGDAILQGFGYARDRAGNITAIDDLSEARPDAPRFDARYTYDAWYRLTEAALDPTGADEVVSLEFDAIDNLLAQESSAPGSLADVGDYGYGDRPNAVLSAGGLDLSYDPAGYMTGRGAQAMTWDFMGRMTSASEGGEQVARFIYGQNQSRVAKLEGDRQVLYVGRDFEVRDGVSALYVRVEGRRAIRIEDDALATELLHDANDDGQIGAADAWLDRDAEGGSGGQLWSSARRLLVETGPADGVTFLHGDHLRSITLATAAGDGGPRIEGERSFYPLGQTRAEVGYVDEYGFTGQEIDRSTGLLHFDFRYYDPTLGRWLSVDPAFATSTASNVSRLGESTTAYNYVAGNVINAYDPTGLGKKNTGGTSITSKFKSGFNKFKSKLSGSKDLTKSKGTEGKYGTVQLQTGGQGSHDISKKGVRFDGELNVVRGDGKLQKNGRGFYLRGETKVLSVEGGGGIHKDHVGGGFEANIVSGRGMFGYQTETGKGGGIGISGGLGVGTGTLERKQVNEFTTEYNVVLPVLDVGLHVETYGDPRKLGFERTYSLSESFTRSNSISLSREDSEAPLLGN